MRLRLARSLALIRGNGLHTARDHDVGAAAGDLVRSNGDRVQAGRAGPADGRAGHGYGQLRQDDGQAGDVAALFADLAGGADNHILHFRRVNLITVKQRIYAVRHHVIRPGQVESTPERLGQPRSYTVHHDNIAHVSSDLSNKKAVYCACIFGPLQVAANRAASVFVIGPGAPAMAHCFCPPDHE